MTKTLQRVWLSVLQPGPLLPSWFTAEPQKRRNFNSVTFCFVLMLKAWLRRRT